MHNFIKLIPKEYNVIYGLIDPNSKELRYIGKALNLRKRFSQHHRISVLKPKTHKNNWLKSLLNKGQSAELVIIEKYNTPEELPQAEIDMIAYFKFIGCDLVNTTNGGEGSLGIKNFLGKHHSQESKNKISESNKGQKRTDETKQNISKSKIGKPSPRLGMIASEKTLIKMSEASKRNKHKISETNTKRFKNKSWSIIDGKRVWSK